MVMSEDAHDYAVVYARAMPMTMLLIMPRIMRMVIVMIQFGISLQATYLVVTPHMCTLVWDTYGIPHNKNDDGEETANNEQEKVSEDLLALTH